jgi:adenylate cyclase class 2
MDTTNEEIEVKFLDVDKEELEKKLVAIGAHKVKDFFYRHVAMDYPDYRLNKDHSWIRLRDEEDKIVLAYKKRLGVSSMHGTNDEGMEEIEVVVDNYETTKLFLHKIGLIEKHEAEKKRTRWQKGETVFDIDTFPALPTYLEIEAPSWAAIDTATEELGFDPSTRKICSGNQIYKMHGIDVNEYQRLGFDGLVKKELS